MPDKALDLLDLACSNARVHLNSEPEEIRKCEKSRRELIGELHGMKVNTDKTSKDKAAELMDRLLKVGDEIAALRLEHKNAKDSYRLLEN